MPGTWLALINVSSADDSEGPEGPQPQLWVLWPKDLITLSHVITQPLPASRGMRGEGEGEGAPASMGQRRKFASFLAVFLAWEAETDRWELEERPRGVVNPYLGCRRK